MESSPQMFVFNIRINATIKHKTIIFKPVERELRTEFSVLEKTVAV